MTTTTSRPTDIEQPLTLTAPMPADTDWTGYTDNAGRVHLRIPAPALHPGGDAAAVRAAVTGDPDARLPQLRYWDLGDQWQVEFYTQTPDYPDDPGPTMTLSITAWHTYSEYDDDVTVYVVDAVVPVPPADEDSDEYDEWAQTYVIDAFTGIGRPDGDSWYDLAVTASSDPSWVGRTFDWGY